MSLGFPSANNNLEQDGFSEESFWPSFTDIMMVIVMVFLLVAVSVILNNYQLVENLKNSMQAQQLASSIAEDTQIENSTLEERLLRLKQQLALANTRIIDSKKEAKKTQLTLSKNQQIIEELNAISTQQTEQLDEKTAYFAALELQSKQQLEEKNAEIITLKNRQKTNKEELYEAQEIASTQQQLVSQLQQQEEESEDKAGDLQAQIASLRNSLTENASEYRTLQTNLSSKSSKIEQLQTTLTKQSSQFTELKKQRNQDESQLLSLQGELDSLDKKYQKLLQPARSAKGKFIVEVVYSKRKGRGVYRIRVDQKGKYKNISRQQLERKLTSLKNKHTSDLYVKVIIPKNSGLSHNEAWKFTSFAHQSYDYYFQSKTDKKDEDEEDEDKTKSQ